MQKILLPLSSFILQCMLTMRNINYLTIILQVKQIEVRDSVLTSDQQINRLLRPGSTYFNLNPFEVLQIEPETPVDQIKKKYRSLSFLVHPDKNQDNKEKAELAFEAVNKAWKTLENDVTRKRCLDVYEEAKDRTDHMVSRTVFNSSDGFYTHKKWLKVN